ncbi:MAG TPA: TadA family conjugal transfer-associated ATPase [Aeromicrobium sp.]|nr:TadA family conjugal transfer-associated ATPase [Aeromicrobium sp.]
MTVDQDLVDRVRRRLIADAAEATAENVGAALRVECGLVDGTLVLDVIDHLRSDSRGFGPLDPVLALPGVTDVLVNGPGAVYLDRGSGLEPADVRLPDAAAVRRLAQRLAAQGGRRLDHASPWVDARLPDGVRLHAVLDPIARPGPAISLRVPAASQFGLADLERLGMIPRDGVTLVRQLVGARVAFVVSGGTGAGKTTLLSALVDASAPTDRVVVVEDSSELRPTHPHVVALEARPPNVEGAGQVTMRDLVRQALRMRPDRLVVGEVRGGEVVELLAALNTGHEGGCGTVHANSVDDVPARFEALAVAAGLSRAALHSQLAAGLRVVLHLVRDHDGTRRLHQIGVLTQRADGLVVPAEALTFHGSAMIEGPAMHQLLALLR